MRESIGSIALYNIIIIFITITFAILAGTMSYSKAFKSNSRIINAIEKYEGYNEASADFIDKYLYTVGYSFDQTGKCPDRRGVESINKINDLNPNYRFCVYAYPEETREYNGRYVRYGVTTYIYIDVPVLGDFIRVPVYGESNRVFCFEGSCSSYIVTLD